MSGRGKSSAFYWIGLLSVNVRIIGYFLSDNTCVNPFCHKIPYIISLNIMDRFMLEQRYDLSEIYWQNKDNWSEIERNVRLNLVVEKDEQFPINASLLLKFEKLVSLLMCQNVSVLAQRVRSQISKLWLRIINSPSFS